jgi:hypothetical protein
MKKTVLLLFVLLSVSSVGFAQRLSPSVIAVGGGTVRTQTMTLDWTLGESFVETATTPTRLYTQGFHQPSLQVSEQPGLADTDGGFKFTVAPNPVASYLRIDIALSESGPLEMFLIDRGGHQVKLPLVPANTTSTQVDMTVYPAGTYLLRIGKANGPLLKTYKIVKAQ